MSYLKDACGEAMGVKFATPSVSSPGLESALNIPAPDYPQTEAGIVSLVKDLQYMNAGDRGLLMLDIQHTHITTNWLFVSSITNESYELLSECNTSLIVYADSGHNTLQEETV